MDFGRIFCGVSGVSLGPVDQLLVTIQVPGILLKLLCG